MCFCEVLFLYVTCTKQCMHHFIRSSLTIICLDSILQLRSGRLTNRARPRPRAAQTWVGLNEFHQLILLRLLRPRPLPRRRLPLRPQAPDLRQAPPPPPSGVSWVAPAAPWGCWCSYPPLRRRGQQAPTQ